MAEKVKELTIDKIDKEKSDKIIDTILYYGNVDNHIEGIVQKDKGNKARELLIELFRSEA